MRLRKTKQNGRQAVLATRIVALNSYLVNRNWDPYQYLELPRAPRETPIARLIKKTTRVTTATMIAMHQKERA